ncbi:L-2-amino-thiazoline-4-carboxylic acid hydrolase [Sorangium sp. So ce861]|uniref:L-2-amino-thiazoline-4-carboxylic acid hydrolase n=1 Tax=Sorangium sp. So ce861 TaxID=3133323 RepID=UPI003F603FED
MAKNLDLRKVTSPVLLHLLGKEMRSPRLFLWRCLLSFPRFKRSIEPRFPAELVDLAALPIWVYINLKQRIGQKRAFEVLRVAMLTGGVAQWNLQFETVDRPRTFATLCDQELRVNQTGITRWNTLEVVERSERRFELKVTRCLYHELAASVGVPELTPIACQIDNAGFNSYLPDEVLFHRGGPGHRISDGAKECRFVWERPE